MISPRHVLAVLALSVAAGSVSAQVKEPPRSEKVDIQIRYRIRAERDERVRQFRALEKYLNSLDFVDSRKDDPDRDLDMLDPTAERLTGSIPSAKVLEVLNNPNVLNILFAPSGYIYPDAPDKPVPIRVILRSGLILPVQQTLHIQALSQLELLGFKDALGYDTRGYTQLKGTIPYKNLNKLVKDLRTEPSGWFFTDTPPDQLPRPLADRNPIRWVEVMPMVDLLPPFEPEKVLPARARLSPDLRARLVDPAAKDTPLLVEAIYSIPMEDNLDQIRTRLAVNFASMPKKNADGTPAKGPEGLPIYTEGASIEGVIANVVTIRFDKPADVDRFLLEAGVVSVRLPRRGIETIAPGNPNQKGSSAAELLKSTYAVNLHRLGYTGSGVKVIVIGSDFTGAEKLIGSALPKNTELVDLTTELNPNIKPLPTDPGSAGQSLATAMAVAVSAPSAELVLVRIDSASFFQLLEIVRLARGETSSTSSMRSRLTEIDDQLKVITKKKDDALHEYRVAFDDLADDEPTRLRRVRAKATLDAVVAQQAELSRKMERYNLFQTQVSTFIPGARVIVNSLVWESGYPLDALNEMSRTLDRLSAPNPPKSIRPATGPNAVPKPHIVWVQTASPAGPAVWGGPFVDANKNGTMEFAPFHAPLPAGSWTPEMNFLGSRSPAGEVSPELAAGVRVRFIMQWREHVDPKVPAIDIPAFPVVLRIFRQVDPNGEKRPSDEMAEDARSAGGPYPILRASTFVVYEQILDFTVPVAGRYAFVVATGYQPDPALPALRRDVEISPRVHIETLAAKAGENRVVFRSYTTPHVGVGIPGDSAGAVAVGLGEEGMLTGGGTGVTLLLKPDLLGPDAIDLPGQLLRGPGVATGFVAGIAADLVQAKVAGANVFRTIGVAPAKLPVLPEAWLRYMRPPLVEDSSRAPLRR